MNLRPATQSDFPRILDLFERVSIDPTLWFLAWEDGAELAGIAICRVRSGIGWVGVLGVDAESLTGASRLYEAVGMRVVRQLDFFEKELGGS